MSLILNPETKNIGSNVRALAEKHGILCTRTPIDALAEHFNRLSGDEIVDLDETQLLLIGLRRAGVLEKMEAMRLQAAYLAEKKFAI